MELPVNPSALIELLRAWFFAKDRSIVLANDTFIEGDEISKPANPVTGRRRLYAKTDCWYDLDSDGNETALCDGPLGAGGRLTLTSNTPVTTSDVSGASTLYYTPYPGSQFSGKIRLYNSSKWQIYTFDEISLSLSGLTSGKNYDIFIYDNAGTLTLELSSAWTNDTTRNDALTLQDNVYIKSGSVTRRYIGTLRTTGTTTTEDSETKRFLWNYYNRVQGKLKKVEATASWAYVTAAYRAANNSTANRVEIVTGLADKPIHLTCAVQFSTSSGTGVAGIPGIDEDGTASNDADITQFLEVPVSGFQHHGLAQMTKTPTLGYHYYQWTEWGGANLTFWGASGVIRNLGLLGYCWR